MNLRIAQINTVTGDINGNLKLMQEAIELARRDGIRLLVFPALSVCGTDLHNLSKYSNFRAACLEANAKVIQNTEGITVIFGTLAPAPATPEKLQAAVIIAENGKQNSCIWSGVQTQDIIAAEAAGLRIGIAGQNFSSFRRAESGHGDASVGFDVCIYSVADPFDGQPVTEKIKVVQKIASAVGCPVVYANQAGGNTSLIHDGVSMFVNKDGKTAARALRFIPGHVDALYDTNESAFKALKKSAGEPLPALIGEKFNAMTTGLRDYLLKSGAAKKVLIGLSGGIDSALVCVIAAEALGPENVIAVTMPSPFSSPESVTDSRKLAVNLGIKLLEIPIESIYNAFTDVLAPVFEDREFSVAEENLQSRTRGDLLMAIANKFGYMVLAPGNKSELAVGYCTLYGDMVGGLAVIGDLFKTEVFEMCTWLNTVYYGREMIPQNIIDKAPSAELRPGQQDTDSLPPYAILDGILHHYLEHFHSFEEITQSGFNPDTTRKVLNLVIRNEHKRRQAAPVLKLSKSAYIIDYNGPLIQKTSGF